MERSSEGEINFVAADKYVRQTAFESIDPETGRPSYNEANTAGHRQGGVLLSVASGAARGLAAGGVQSGPPASSISRPMRTSAPSSAVWRSTNVEPGELYIGVPIDVILSPACASTRAIDTAEPVTIGQLQAWDMNTGEMKWAHDFKGHGVLGTASHHGR